jgi:hypothetical protein
MQAGPVAGELARVSKECFRDELRRTIIFAMAFTLVAPVMRSIGHAPKPILHGLAGVGLGMLVCFVVTASLLEIAINRFFAIYFGLLFAVVGLVIMVRVWAGTFSTPLRASLTCLAVIVLLAGISCAIVDHNSLGLSSGARVPLFSILGMAVSFAVTFALVDVVNAMAGAPVVASSAQVFWVLVRPGPQRAPL